MRTRRDVAGLTLGDTDSAQTKDWHPVLDTYARGVGLMLDLDAQHPLGPDSWRWAANTHYLDNQTPFRPAWRQCKHESLYFLPWHRAYLAWFESTIRRLTGDDDWALPYWDYSSPGATRTLPPEFTVPTRTVDGTVQDNALFWPGRSTVPLPAGDVDVTAALSEPRYVKELVPGFGGAVPDQHFGLVESRPHNYVHMAIGGAMQSTGTAGRDPIFWLHHANIDRLWQVWLSLPGSIRLTDPGAAPAALVTQWNSAKFWFGIESAPVIYPMSEIENLASAAMNYEYESIDLPPDVAAVVISAREAATDGEGELALDDTRPRWEPVGATFHLSSGELRDVSTGGLGIEEAVPARLLLEITEATATAPHSAYLVEIRSRHEAPPHIAGGFSTFGLAGTPAEESRNYLIDATSVVPDLVEEGWSGGQLSVQIVPEPGRPDSEDQSRSIQVAQVKVYVQR
jgi:hypothetical protein